jgi:hypothetical protein
MRRVKTDFQHAEYHDSSNDANNRSYCLTSNSELACEQCAQLQQHTLAIERAEIVHVPQSNVSSA